MTAGRDAQRMQRARQLVQTERDSPDRDAAGREVPVIGHGGLDAEEVAKDQELMLWLSTDGLYGQAWEALADRVLPLGINTIQATANDGSILRHLRRLQVTPTAALLHILRTRDFEQIHDLAVESALDALDYWRRKVIPEGRWRPQSQLSTYFVNVCFMRVPRTASRLVTPEQVVDEEKIEVRLHRERGRQPSVVEAVIARQDWDRLLEAMALLNEDERALLLEAFHERPQELMSGDRNLSVRAIEGRLHRLRQRLRQGVA